jgi:peptide-methionine (S)-S-oxide reductase
MGTQKATFAAGCFWGVEAEFRKIKGVLNATVGYAGGELKAPSYEDVCSGKTGHAESTLVEFDPAQVSYAKLLSAFWAMIDPTALNRQGPDVGSQYRSVIFCHTEEQKQQALASRQEEQKKYRQPIVTEIVPAGEFWKAEEYHQRYFEKHGGGSCHI